MNFDGPAAIIRGNEIMNWPASLPDLRDHGAGDVDFGDAIAEARIALESTVVVPLAHLGIIAARGADTVPFLQGQLSNDVRKLSPTTAQLSSYNSPKGRMLAVLHLFRDPETIFLELNAAVLPAVLKRLRMYVMRSKVTLADESPQRPALGLSGPRAVAALEAAGLPCPGAPLGSNWKDATCVIRRQDALGQPRFTVHSTTDALADLWTALSRHATPAGTLAWRRLEIEAGVPTVMPVTSDHFVPQMCNLDQLGGISFDKGCYTGQEIVARIHYRGAIKRRMSAIDHPDADLRAGARVDEPAGAEVVDAVPAPGGGCRALVVASAPSSN